MRPSLVARPHEECPRSRSPRPQLHRGSILDPGAAQGTKECRSAARTSRSVFGELRRSPRERTMVDQPTSLDEHRGMAAQVATDLRRLRAEVDADQAALRERRNALEKLLMAAPSANWSEAVEKARYLLSLFAETPAAADPRRQKLMEDLLTDFERLLRDPVDASPTA